MFTLQGYALPFLTSLTKMVNRIGIFLFTVIMIIPASSEEESTYLIRSPGTIYIEPDKNWQVFVGRLVHETLIRMECEYGYAYSSPFKDDDKVYFKAYHGQWMYWKDGLNHTTTSQPKCIEEKESCTNDSIDNGYIDNKGKYYCDDGYDRKTSYNNVKCIDSVVYVKSGRYEYNDTPHCEPKRTWLSHSPGTIYTKMATDVQVSMGSLVHDTFIRMECRYGYVCPSLFKDEDKVYFKTYLSKWMYWKDGLNRTIASQPKCIEAKTVADAITITPHDLLHLDEYKNTVASEFETVNRSASLLSDESRNRLYIWQIILIVIIGAILTAILVITTSYILWKKKNKSLKNTNKSGTTNVKELEAEHEYETVQPNIKINELTLAVRHANSLTRPGCKIHGSGEDPDTDSHHNNTCFYGDENKTNIGGRVYIDILGVSEPYISMDNAAQAPYMSMENAEKEAYMSIGNAEKEAYMSMDTAGQAPNKSMDITGQDAYMRMDNTEQSVLNVYETLA